MRRWILALALALLLPKPGLAVGLDDVITTPPPDGRYVDAVGLVEAGRFEEAAAKLEALVRDRPGDPEAHNYLAFSYHKLGRYDEAFEHYERALAIDPGHLGALEYLGELHLTLGELEQAESLLARLGELCPQGCAEYDELADAIAAHEAAGD